MEPVTINTSNFNKPFSPSPRPPLVSITRVDKGPTAPHGDTKGMVTGTSPCRLTRITLQALLALLSPDSTSGGGGNRKGHLLMSMPSKATTTRTGKGVNLNQNNKNSGTLALPTPSLSAKHLRAGEPVSSLRSLLFSASSFCLSPLRPGQC